MPFADTKGKTLAIIGQAIILSSIQVSIGSVEMSSKFSVLSFAKDQDTLQRAADALSSYIIIGSLWAVGCILLQFSEDGMKGLAAGLFFNLAIMSWLIISYWKAFREATKKYNLKMPKMFDGYFGTVS